MTLSWPLRIDGAPAHSPPRCWHRNSRRENVTPGPRGVGAALPSSTGRGQRPTSPTYSGPEVRLRRGGQGRLPAVDRVDTQTLVPDQVRSGGGDPEWILSNRREESRPRRASHCLAFDQLDCLHKLEQWPDLKSFFVIESERSVKGRTTLEHCFCRNSFGGRPNVPFGRSAIALGGRKQLSPLR
jgi:hypothetical protein